MKQTAFVLAALFGAVNSVQVNSLFATGMNGDEDLGEDITMKGDKFHYVQQHPPQNVVAFAQAASKSGSGVRARWIELPDCQGAVGVDTSIPLKDDLSNAIIATCKGKRAGTYDPNAQYQPDQTLPPNLPDDPTAGNELAGQQINSEPPQIYDAVIKASKHTFLDHEHHVTQQEHGNVDPTDGSAGPHGVFFYNTTCKSGGDCSKFNRWASKGQWTALPQDGDHFSLPFTSFVQTDEEKAAGWVELPTCVGKKDEVYLAKDLANATVATCKRDPENPPNPSAHAAAEALDGMTPKAGGF